MLKHLPPDHREAPQHLAVESEHTDNEAHDIAGSPRQARAGPGHSCQADEVVQA